MKFTNSITENKSRKELAEFQKNDGNYISIQKKIEHYLI